MRKLDIDEPNPSGLCQCGCGKKTSLAPQGSKQWGWVKGKPVRYLPGHSGHKYTPTGGTPELLRCPNKPAVIIHTSAVALVSLAITAVPLRDHNGDVLAFALVETRDVLLVVDRRWYKFRHGRTDYAWATVSKGVRVRMHALILPPGPGLETDHRNGHGLDNRRSNLRECIHADNSKNRRLNCDNRSGYKGVSRYKRGKRWNARITVNGRIIKLGSFDTAIDAARAYDEAARRLHGPFARINGV